MENSVDMSVTPESILANLKEVTLSFEKLRLAMEQSSAEADKRKKEWDEKFEKEKNEWDEKFENDIPGIIKQAETFRINYPKYQNHRIYLALASFVFNQRLEQEYAKYGIAIVKQVGNSWVINEEHLKAY